MLILAATAAPGRAGVSVSIGINLAAPPPLVAIPSSPVMYAPAAPANYFFYGGQYYVFTRDNWYLGPDFNGPWTTVAPAYVPPPILAVPVRYYRVRPLEWRRWHPDAPPHCAARRPRPRTRIPVEHRREHRDEQRGEWR